MDELQKFSERFNDLMYDFDINAETLSKEINVAPSLICRWRKPNTDKFLSTLIKLADYFQCSIDYLCGRSEEKLPFIIQKCPDFFLRLEKIIKEKEKTTYKLFNSTKIKSSHYYRWKSGQEPKMTSLIVLADFLDCSIDYLIGREK